MIALLYIFLVFFITLGPPRTVPAFAALAQAMDQRERKALALAGVAVATGISLLVAVFGIALRQVWDLPWKALSIAVGLILFLSAMKTLSGAWGPSPPSGAGRPWRTLAISPLAAPIIVTPHGVAAILLFLAAREGDATFVLEVVGALIAVMALNLTLMLAARPVMRIFGFSPMRVAGWVFSILLAVLAVQAIVEPVRAYVADLRTDDSETDEEGQYEDALFVTPFSAAPDIGGTARGVHGPAARGTGHRHRGSIIAIRSGQRPAVDG